MVVFFSITLFFSAALLFLVQPMVGKMILPSLGGTPAVWNTCMVFFQAVLLAGYAYAHGTVNRLGARRQAILHLVVLATPFVVLPIVVGQGVAPPSDSDPVAWLLGHLLLRVGLPFFAVSASAPLLQRWFSKTGHSAASDPYFLYAASNVGSLLALLGYPFVVERVLDLSQQSSVWHIGYAVLYVLVAGCAVLLWRSPRTAVGSVSGLDAAPIEAVPSPDSTVRPPPSNAARARWVFLSFVPSSLMLGVTTYVTTDLAPVPLLWVVPLAIYLLTFALVFARKPLIGQATMMGWFPFLIAPAAVMSQTIALVIPGWFMIPLLLGSFFVAAMVCHGKLAALRPAARHLTEFYLWVSIGGVLGGLFNAVAAPLIFDTLLEYPLVMVLACLALPWKSDRNPKPRERYLDLALPVGLGLATLAIQVALLQLDMSISATQIGIKIGLPLLGCLALRRRALRFALGLAAVLVVSGYCARLDLGEYLYVGRNFYGVKAVVDLEGGAVRTLQHGNISHGLQWTDPRHSTEPIAYYHPDGPLGDIFRALDRTQPGVQIGDIGLGIGTISTYVHPGQTITFFEIDPRVADLAQDPDRFTFLSQCAGDYEIVLGDGRLAIARQPDGRFDILILDAFSSDAVPTHLLTREALQLYLTKIKDEGVLVYNLSNRYLGLTSLLGNLAAETGLTCLVRDDEVDPEVRARTWRNDTTYVVLARSAEVLAPIAALPGWETVEPDPDVPVWTDQFSNILSLLWRF
ncbi:MAG: hypothetical protein GY778_04730 [bacterium]|nr:hypothetical protein [bacterium]